MKIIKNNRYRPINDYFCSNWFIYSFSNHPIICKIYDILIFYYSVMDKTIYYFLWYSIFQLIVDYIYPEYYNIFPCKILESDGRCDLIKRIYRKYDPKKWNKITSKHSFYKLNWRANDKSKYYSNMDYIIDTYYAVDKLL